MSGSLKIQSYHVPLVRFTVDGRAYAVQMERDWYDKLSQLFDAVGITPPAPTEIPEHNALDGLQGGNPPANEFYHLSLADYTKVLALPDVEPPEALRFYGITSGGVVVTSTDGFTWEVADLPTVGATDAQLEMAVYGTHFILAPDIADSLDLYDCEAPGSSANIYTAAAVTERFNIQAANGRVYFETFDEDAFDFAYHRIELDGSIVDVALPAFLSGFGQYVYGDGVYTSTTQFDGTYDSAAGLTSWSGPFTFDTDPPLQNTAVLYLSGNTSFATLGQLCTVSSRVAGANWTQTTVTVDIVTGGTGNAELLGDGDSVLTFMCAKAAGVEIYKSTDGGATWTLKQSYSGTSPDVHRGDGFCGYVGGLFIFQYTLSGVLSFATSADGDTWSTVASPGALSQVWGVADNWHIFGYSTTDWASFASHATTNYPAANAHPLSNRVIVISP